MMRTCALILLLFMLGNVLANPPSYQLLDQWRIISSAQIPSDGGSAISTVGFNDTQWYACNVPANGTVMATLIQNGLYPDIFYGINYENVDKSQFDVPWWYRTEFEMNVTESDIYPILTFKGINYKANVFINGVQLYSTDDVIGAFRYYEMNLAGIYKQRNAVALQIYQPYNNLTGGLDLAITFVDWAPVPMDNNMGLWQDVELRIGGPVTVKYPMVNTDLTSLYLAHLTIMVEITNYAATPVTGILTATIPGVGECAQKLAIPENSVQQEFIYNTSCPYLNVQNPKLWWPIQMGTPNLYNLTLTFTMDDGTVSDELQTNFGIRTMTKQLVNGNAVFSVNGKPILIRGAGWSPDLFQRTSPIRQLLELDYVLDMRLNAIRLEGKFENDNLFNLADQYGILMMPGMCCCDAWQRWDEWTFTQFEVAEASLRSQLKRLRIHASVLVFLYSSDDLPPANVEELYLSVVAEEYWPNPTLSSAGDTPSNLTGPSGVKMSGPYSWVSPNYWLTDTIRGGAFGFLTEGGPGEAPMTIQSWQNTIPASHYWPIDNYWNAHNGASFGNFGTLDRFTSPLNARYGNATSMEDYIWKSQIAAYEGHRAMFEGYSRNKYTSTGVIQWMLNNAYPENIWHLYDYYLNTGGSYFGSKKACEPIHVMYGYDDNSVWVVNSMYEFVDVPHNISAEIFNINGTKLYSNSQISNSLKADSASKIFALPAVADIPGLSVTYFVRLRIYENSAVIVSDNFYWLSTQLDVINESAWTWFNTPCSQYADLTGIQQITAAPVTLSQTYNVGPITTTVSVQVENPSKKIAFLVQLGVVGAKTNATILPALWSDNFVTLMAGDSVQLTVSMYTNLLQGDSPLAVILHS